MRDRLALKKACRWLSALSIPDEDIESHILRLFALAVAGASVAQIRACGAKLRHFDWQNYSGDPVPAIVAHLALTGLSVSHDSLALLEQAYRSVLLTSKKATHLLCGLLAIPFTPNPAVHLLDAERLVRSSREEVLAICRTILLDTGAGSVPVEIYGAGFLPALTLSYARDWDLEACCALLRSCAYLNVSNAKEHQWAVDWLLDQQMSDGRFGLLHPEAMHGGVNADDWRSYFERTVYATWALADTRGEVGTNSFLSSSSHGPRFGPLR
jgi:hypothetical protein